MSALILATTSTEGGGGGGGREESLPSSKEGRGKGSARASHLEKRVRQLERKLEEKDRDGGKTMRALQQKYSAMEVMESRARGVLGWGEDGGGEVGGGRMEEGRGEEYQGPVHEKHHSYTCTYGFSDDRAPMRWRKRKFVEE